MEKTFDSLRGYLRAIFRRKWAFLIPTIVGAVAAPALWRSSTPRYRASAMVRRKNLTLAESAPGYYAPQGNPMVSVAALRAEMLTWKSLRRVIQQTNLDPSLESEADWQEMYRKLRKNISIQTEAEGQGVHIIEIAAVHENPDTTAAIANALADNYLEKAKKESRSDTETAVKFLQEQTDSYHQKLLEAEENLENYKEEHFTDVPSVRENILGQMLSLRTEEAATERRLAETRSRLEKVSKQLAEVPQVVSGEKTSKENPVHTRLEARLNELEAAQTELLARYTEKHPDVQQLQRQIAEVKRQLEETPGRIAGTETEVANPEYQDLQMKRRELEQSIQGLEVALSDIRSRIELNRHRLQSIVAEEKRYNELVRDRNEYQKRYEQYRDRLVSARTRMKVESGQYGTQAEMAARALVPTWPYKAPRIKLAILSLVGGIGLGVALLVGLEYFDNSFRGVEDAASYLGIPVLASIPTIVTAEQKARKRRRKLIAGGTLLFLLVVGGGAAAFMEMRYPGFLGELALRVQDRLAGLASRVHQ